MKVLHVGSTLNISGGIESFIMNIYKAINKTDIQFDFLVTEKNAHGYYRDYISANGGKIFIINEDTLKLRVFIEKYKIYKLYNNNIIHIHTNCGSRIFDGLIAKIAGVKRIIFHSHTCKGKPNFKFRFLQPIFRFLGTDFWACSENSAIFFFGEKILASYTLVYNAIDVERFKFNINIRNKIRNLNNWNDYFILGFVGRLSPEKNIPFMLSILDSMKKKQIKTKLVIVGDGQEEEKNKIFDILKNKKLCNDVSFLGERQNVQDYLSAFDTLILPSYYEGLGIVLIEGQASGLTCYASSTVPKETKVTSRIKYLSLNVDASKWAECIISDFYSNNINRKIYNEEVFKSRYNIKIESLNLINIYKNILEK